MKTSITVTHMIVRITGLIQIVLGLLFWAGILRGLVSIHMLIGVILVIALWVLAVLTARSGAPLGFAILTFVWGIIVVALGVTQVEILPGGPHWVIQLTHLIVGLAAMGLGERLVRMSKFKQKTALPA